MGDCHLRLQWFFVSSLGYCCIIIFVYICIYIITSQGLADQTACTASGASGHVFRTLRMTGPCRCDQCARYAVRETNSLATLNPVIGVATGGCIWATREACNA